jgi:hypothetical protein
MTIWWQAALRHLRWIGRLCMPMKSVLEKVGMQVDVLLKKGELIQVFKIADFCGALL